MIANNDKEQQQQNKKYIKKEVQVTIIGNKMKKYVFPSFQDYPFIVEPQYDLFIIKGWGTYGIVASGVRNNQPVAVKRIHKVFDDLGDTKRILRQIKILKFLKHKNIVGLKDMMSILHEERQTYNEVYLCMEYMEYTLQKLIHSNIVPLTQPMVQFIIYQLLSAINYMHSADIIHRDIKPQNILINKKLELKITDMNLARKEIAADQNTYYVTTRPYRAPQIIINSTFYTKAIDIWAVGCILAQMIGKTVLFQGKDYIDQLRRFVAILGKPPIELFPDLDPIAAQGLARIFKDIPDRQKINWKFLFPNASEKFLDLLDHMLVYDPKIRYTAQDCLNHPFLQQFKNRPRHKCKQTFDFAFDKIQMTKTNLRNAIFDEVQGFKQRRIRKPQRPQDFEIIQKKLKTN